MENGLYFQKMDESRGQEKEEIKEEEEYVLLDLDSVAAHIHIPPNAPYILSALDTLNPVLTIDNKIKLINFFVKHCQKQSRLFLQKVVSIGGDSTIEYIGEYEETIGTCLVFNESDAAPDACEETGPSEANIFSGKQTMDPKQIPVKQVNPLASLHRVLKFKLVLEADGEDGTDKQANNPSDGRTSNAIT